MKVLRGRLLHWPNAYIPDASLYLDQEGIVIDWGHVLVLRNLDLLINFDNFWMQNLARFRGLFDYFDDLIKIVFLLI